MWAVNTRRRRGWTSKVLEGDVRQEIAAFLKLFPQVVWWTADGWREACTCRVDGCLVFNKKDERDKEDEKRANPARLKVRQGEEYHILSECTHDTSKKTQVTYLILQLKTI